MDSKKEIRLKAGLGWTLVLSSSLVLTGLLLESIGSGSSISWCWGIVCSLGIYAGIYNLLRAKELRKNQDQQPGKC